MAEWIEVARLDELPLGGHLERVAGDRIVALFNVAGDVYALDGVCPHQGGPLGQGELRGCIVTCPWHGWQFDVRDGKSQISPTLRQPTLPTKVHEQKIYVLLDCTTE